MGSRALLFARGFLAAYGLALLMACFNQGPDKDAGVEPEETWDIGPYLESLILVQESLAGDSSFRPREVPMSPESPEREYAHFGGRVYAGSVALLAFTNSRGVVSVRFRGAAVPESRWTDGRPCYRFAIDSDGDAEVAVRDPNSGLRRIYRVSLALRTSAEPWSTSLRNLWVASQQFSHGSLRFTLLEMSPVFHPDSLEYSAHMVSVYANEGLRLRAIPLDPFSDAAVRYNGVVVEPETLAGDTASYPALLDSTGRFTISVTHVPTGKTREYGLSVEKLRP